MISMNWYNIFVLLSLYRVFAYEIIYVISYSNWIWYELIRTFNSLYIYPYIATRIFEIAFLSCWLQSLRFVWHQIGNKLNDISTFDFKTINISNLYRYIDISISWNSNLNKIINREKTRFLTFVLKLFEYYEILFYGDFKQIIVLMILSTNIEYQLFGRFEVKYCTVLV